MTYVSAEQVLYLHHLVIQDTGGSPGVIDLGLILSAVERPKASFDGEDLYPDLPSKAAVLLESLARNHGFLDGNKRTAVMSFWEFLTVNGYRAELSDLDLYDNVMGLVTGAIACAEVAELLRHVLTPLDE
jgi:death-on-curing protein